jgi:hypothetical protein
MFRSVDGGSTIVTTVEGVARGGQISRDAGETIPGAESTGNGVLNDDSDKNH